MPLDPLEKLVPLMDDRWQLVDAAGRGRSEIDISWTTGLPGAGHDGFDAAAHVAELDRMVAAGVTWNGTSVPGDSVAHAIEALEQYGAEVIAPTR